jgi:hypothetical protein
MSKFERTVLIAAAVLMVAAVTLIVLNEASSGGKASSSRTSARPSPSASPFPSASSLPTPGLTPPPSASPTPSLARRAVTAAALADATLDVPSWGALADAMCPHGPVVFSHNDFDPSHAYHVDGGLSEVAIGDVDGDGIADGVAIVACVAGDPPIAQTVAFDRTVDGTFHTLGQIVASTDGGVTRISNLDLTSAHTVKLTVDNLAGSDGEAAAAAVTQTRTYAWSVNAFTQTDGPAAFSVVAPLTVHTSTTVFVPTSRGNYAGATIITLTNGGTSPVTDISVVILNGTDVVDFASGGCGTINKVYPDETCTVGTLAAGASRSLTVRTVVSGADMPTVVGSDVGHLDIQVRVGSQFLAGTPITSTMTTSN